MMQVHLVVNMRATTATPRARDDVTRILAAACDVEVHTTTRRGHATALARDAVETGADAVFVLGGDGTTNEAMQPLIGTDVVLGLAPGGGTNVMARAVGLPNDPVEATRIQLAGLLGGTRHRLGLGEANGRAFSFQAGVGLDASIVARVEAHPGMKRGLRQASFVLLGLREWATNIDRRDPSVLIEQIDGAPPAGPGRPRMMVVAGNLDPYTFLGPRPFRLVPGVERDGGLDLLLAEPTSTARMLRAIGRAFARGNHDLDPAFTLVHDVREVRMRCTRPTDLMVDGDHLGAHTEVVLRHLPSAIVIAVPRAL